MRNLKLIKILILCGGVLPTLAACSTDEAATPVGIGTGVDEYKRSHCACIELDQRPVQDGDMDRIRELLS